MDKSPGLTGERSAAGQSHLCKPQLSEGFSAWFLLIASPFYDEQSVAPLALTQAHYSLYWPRLPRDGEASRQEWPRVRFGVAVIVCGTSGWEFEDLPEKCLDTMEPWAVAFSPRRVHG